MTTHEYKQKILESVMNEEYLFGHENFGLFCPAGEGIVAKIFLPLGTNFSKEESQKEFENLKKLKGLKDPRIKVPEAYDLLYLGKSKELRGFEHYFKNNLVYAVVIELFEGKHWGDDMRWYERRKYSKSLIELIDALIEHKIVISDLKSEELICLKNSDKVGLVDTHLTRWWGDKSNLAYVYGLLYEEAKKARSIF